MNTGIMLNGGILGVDPSLPGHVYLHQEAIGFYENIKVTKHSNGLYDVLFVASNMQLSIQSNGNLETRAAGTFGLYESLTMIKKNVLSRVGIQLTLVNYSSLELLRIQGQDFINESNQRISLNGTDQFLAFHDFYHGRDLTPFANESNELGFNMWRVHFSGSKRQNQLFDLFPDESVYKAVKPFVGWCNDHNIIPLVNINVDMQDIFPNESDRIRNWQRMNNEMLGLMVLVSGGNQFPKNGFSPGELFYCGNIWSRGSSTEDPNPFEPWPNGASFAEFHPTRISYQRGLMDSVSSPITLTDKGLNVPLIISEPNGWNEDSSRGRYNIPSLAYKFARHYSTECAGFIFHNDFGQSGRLMEPITRECAKEWCRGAQL